MGESENEARPSSTEQPLLADAAASPPPPSSLDLLWV